MSLSSCLNILFAFLAFLSLAIGVWRWIASLRFPLHQRLVIQTSLPGVTLLKPLKGCELETTRSLRSWMIQRYPSPVQILFGVASPDDPVCAVVRGLLAEYPKVDAQLVICHEDHGVNAKVSSLRQMQPLARHDFIVVSDADVRVSDDFLINLTPLFDDPQVGLVNCFYSLANPTTLAMRWEAIAINADFWSEVLQARSMKEVDFALGAVMALPRAVLEKMGGFAQMADYLADDYHLGQEVSKQGKKIVFAQIAVECWEHVMNFNEVWRHQLRWGRTIRCCQPLPFFLSILSNATLWPVVWFLYFTASHPYHDDSRNVALWLAAASLLFCAIGFRITSALQQQMRLTRSTEHFGAWWLIPVKDLLNVLIWAFSFLGNHVTWRHHRYRILPGGKLERDE